MRELAPNPDPTSRFVFVLGLHRSGTSLVHTLLRSHPEVVALTDTGVREDEGQHLQAVLPLGKEMGGPGKFAWHAEARLTERDLARYPRAADRMCRDWAPYFKGDGGVFVEKSPSNLLRAPFLAAAFPNSRFIVVVRHPVAVSYATQKWRRVPLAILVRHWAHAYTVAARDVEQLGGRAMVVRYEDLLSSPVETLGEIQQFAGLAPSDLDSSSVRPGLNQKYVERWAARRRRLAGVTTWPLLPWRRSALMFDYDILRA